MPITTKTINCKVGCKTLVFLLMTILCAIIFLPICLQNSLTIWIVFKPANINNNHLVDDMDCIDVLSKGYFNLLTSQR